jgi:cell division inhibitor SepF
MLDKFKEFIGIDDNYDDELIDEEEQASEDSASYSTSSNFDDNDYSNRDSSSEVYSAYNNSYKNEYSSSRKLRGGDNIVNMSDTNFAQASNRFRISIQEPVNYDDDAPKVVDDILNKKVVVLNLEMIEIDKKRQIFDFVSGAVYALNGKIEKVTKGIFVICPKGIEIDNSVTDQISMGNFNQL